MSDVRTISRRVCKGCGVLFDDPPTTTPWPRGYCTATCARDAKAAAKRASEASTPAPVIPLPSPHATPGDDDYQPPAPKPIRIGPRKPRMGASKSQRAKRQGRACIVTGDTDYVDSAHLWDRSLGGCNDPDCIVPLRRDLHELYDAHKFDLLPHLLAHGCIAELQHALEHARGDLVGLLNRLTGDRYVPERTEAP